MRGSSRRSKAPPVAGAAAGRSGVFLHQEELLLPERERLAAEVEAVLRARNPAAAIDALAALARDRRAMVEALCAVRVVARIEEQLAKVPLTVRRRALQLIADKAQRGK